MKTVSGYHTSPIGSGYTLVPHRYPMWGTWGTFLLFPPFWGTYFSQVMRVGFCVSEASVGYVQPSLPGMGPTLAAHKRLN